MLTPDTKSFLHVPRSHGRGWGLTVIYRRELNIIQQSTQNYHSLEYMCVILKNDSNLFHINLCYRLPPSNYNNMTHHSFLSEFYDMTDNQLYSVGQLIILGDYNYHLDSINNSLATQFKSLLESSDLSQHVVGHTHKHGHTLDLVITRSSEQFISEIRTYKLTVSDHYFVTTCLETSTRENIN